MPYTGGADHGPSIKNPAVYESLIAKEGMSKSQAAAISNSALKKGHKKGRHRGKSRSHGRTKKKR